MSGAHQTELTDLLADAESYNARLAAGLEGILDETDARYLAKLVRPGSNVISRVVVPAIDVALPVFHGTASWVLDKGVGHLYGTALPVGNQPGSTFGVHTVLTAHSGIDTNSLFNDLHFVSLGEVFLVETAGRQMFYRIDQITVVPEDILKTFAADVGQDLVTLITCTPIGINSHRLLVRGSRYFPDAEIAEHIASYIPVGQRFPFFAIAWLAPTAASGVAWRIITRPKKLNRNLTEDIENF